MPVRPILIYPDPHLKSVCAPVESFDDSARSLINDLIDTMDAGPPRTVGIAAPQIGALLRVVVVDVSRNPKYTSQNGLLTLINPRISEHSGEQYFREGCLSIPEYTANIRRWDKIRVEARGMDGSCYSIEASGFESVVLQHELDHLDGILFLDRVANVKTDLFQRKRQ
jgi:peptide deformylase